MIVSECLAKKIQSIEWSPAARACYSKKRLAMRFTASDNHAVSDALDSHPSIAENADFAGRGNIDEARRPLARSDFKPRGQRERAARALQPRHQPREPRR